MRGIVVLLLLLLLLVGGAWYLSGSAREVPTRQIEIDLNSEAAKP